MCGAVATAAAAAAVVEELSAASWFVRNCNVAQIVAIIIIMEMKIVMRQVVNATSRLTHTPRKIPKLTTGNLRARA